MLTNIRLPMKYMMPLTFVLLLLSGCLSPEGQIAKTEGIRLHYVFGSQCDVSAWEMHPKDVQLVRVKRLRNKQVRTGQNCNEFDTLGGSITQCKDTYKTVQEAYYTDEYQDLNKSYRGRFYRSCMADECFSAVDWNDPSGDLANKYCKSG